MNLVFFEAPVFTRLLPDYMDDRNYQDLQVALMEDPTRGELMPGTGGFRKLRWRDTRRGKGKRGGLRIIYYYLISEHQIWFVTIYDKDEMTDLTVEEKRILKRAIQTELAVRRSQQ